jgi:hypothetical protein
VEFYPATKNEILLFASKWMKLEHIILWEVSQAQKAKNHMFSFIWLFFVVSILCRNAGESEFPYLVVDLRGKVFSFLTLIMLKCSCEIIIYGVSIYSIVKKFTAIPNLLKAFIWKRYCISSNVLFTSNEKIKWLLFSILLMWSIMLINLLMSSQVHIPGINPTCLWFVIFLICC